MALQCFTWTTELLGSLFNIICKDEEDLAETFGRLPDCLIIDVLSRLPLDCLVRFQRDCRDLRALISTHDFATVHLSRARPMLLIHDFVKSTKNGQQLYVFGTEHLNGKNVFRKLHLRPELMINNKRWEKPPILQYSCQGVLLFVDRMWPIYYALNPITQEEVTIKNTPVPGKSCALYFCPLTRQFKLLYAQARGSLCQYFVYMFKTRTWRKIHSSSTFNFLPYLNSHAVVNGALHWIMYADFEKEGIPPCANGIMVFRMDKEELSAMPHPGSVCTSKKVHTTMTLLVKENCLSFCHLLVSEYAVDIWILEDYEMRAWNKRYKVNLFDKKIFPFSLPYILHGSASIDVYWWIKLINIQGGELLFYLCDRGLFSYNLDHKTVKIFELPQQKESYACRTYIESLLAIT
ncbi:putative F-box protein At3g17480 [Nicotiana tomentosiformis]|uniref:putative F-box protein At3g17480 n=1 Tax=Nicotiana tomentosiformis TaxID=4098 RepID=UPI00388C6CF8